MSITLEKLGYDIFLDRSINVTPMAVAAGKPSGLVNTSTGINSTAAAIPVGGIYLNQVYPVISTYEVLQSSNFEEGTGGWQISGQGPVIIYDGTFEGAISNSTIDIGGDTGFHVDLDGNQWFGSATLATAPLSMTSAGVFTSTVANITLNSAITLKSYTVATLPQGVPSVGYSPPSANN